MASTIYGVYAEDYTHKPFAALLPSMQIPLLAAY